MGTIIGITGTPGTGKKSIAPLVAASLGLSCIGIPQPKNKIGSESADEAEVDTEKVRRALLRRPPGSAVAYGHLLPYVMPRTILTRAVVLRCEPMVLKERLLKRGYPYQKTRDNVEAELIGIIAEEAFRSFGRAKTLEFDTSASSPESAARAISAAVRKGEGSSDRIDWMVNYRSARSLRNLLSLQG